MSNRKKIFYKKAFLLFEVAISISILSIGLIFVIRSITYSINAAQQAIEYVQAQGLLSQKAFELQLESDLLGLELVSEEGLFEKNPSYSWRYSVERIQPNFLGGLNLYINWNSLRRKNNLGINTYVRIKE